MAKNYIGKGSRIYIPVNTITGAVSAGDLVTINALTGVALNDGAANDANVLKLDGEFVFPKETAVGSGGAIGAAAYVTGTGTVTADLTGNTKIGMFTQVAADGDTTARVRLDAIGTG